MRCEACKDRVDVSGSAFECGVGRCRHADTECEQLVRAENTR